jgi:pentafunctional AROM polypeptide
MACSVLQEMTKKVDAVELRVDLLEKKEDFRFIACQIASIRQKIGPEIPIIFTVRSTNQGGQFVDDETRIFPILEWGIRLGCEFIDMECCWSFERREKLIQQKRHAAIVSSFHAIQKPTSPLEARAIFDQCYHQGKVEIVKVVLKAFQVQDAYMIHQVASAWRKGRQVQIIALCTMEEGKLSRVLNRVLTPVTHPLLTTIAAPGQLNVQEIMSLRKTLGLLKGTSSTIQETNH